MRAICPSAKRVVNCGVPRKRVNPERPLTAAERSSRYRQRHPEKVAAKARRYFQRHPDAVIRQRARAAVRNAIVAGRMERQPCEVCGETAEAHHEDYSKPLEVRWLCGPHHRDVHRAGRITVQVER